MDAPAASLAALPSRVVPLGPREQLPPLMQLHVAPEQEHAPVQNRSVVAEPDEPQSRMPRTPMSPRARAYERTKIRGCMSFPPLAMTRRKRVSRRRACQTDIVVTEVFRLVLAAEIKSTPAGCHGSALVHPPGSDPLFLREGTGGP